MIIFLVYKYQKKNKGEIKYEYEEEQQAMNEEERKVNDEITLKELEIIEMQENINNIIDGGISDLTDEEISNILINMYPECENEIKLEFNSDEMLMCFIDIENKRKTLIGHDECIIEFNDKNLKEINIAEIIACIDKQILEEAAKNMEIILEEAAGEVAGKIAEDKADAIFEESKKQENNINGEFKTASGIKYKVGALQIKDDLFNNYAGQITGTKCGTSQDTVTSVGYDITITHPDNINETTICIFRSGVIVDGKPHQMEKDGSLNDWYIYNNNENVCIDWGIYIPRNGQLNKLEQTGKFIFYSSADNVAGTKINDPYNSSKYTLFETKDYCETVNQKRYSNWYYWDINKDTDLCRNYDDCCGLYTGGSYESDANDNDTVQFIREKSINGRRVTDKPKDASKINLYQVKYMCQGDAVENDTYKYNINTNSCTNRNSKKTSNERMKLNAGLDPDSVNDIENIYYPVNNCPLLIKKKYYRYSFDNTTNSHKCIQLISDTCDTYGDPDLCNYNELNNWVNDNDFDLKIYQHDQLELCKDTHEREKLYLFDDTNNKCNEIIFKKGESRENSSTYGFKYYDTEDECEKEHLKYLAFNISACHGIESRSFNNIEKEYLDKNKSGDIIKFKKYIKMNNSNNDKYGITSGTKIWDNGFLIRKYNRDYYGGIDLCIAKANEFKRRKQL